MRTALIATTLAAATFLGACSHEPMSTAASLPSAAAAPTQGQVVVTYAPPTTREDLTMTAVKYCKQQFQSKGARYLSDDWAGHTVYSCEG